MVQVEYSFYLNVIFVNDYTYSFAFVVDCRPYYKD